MDEDLGRRDCEERSDRSDVGITAAAPVPGTALERAQASTLRSRKGAAGECGWETGRESIVAYADWHGAAGCFRGSGTGREWQQNQGELTNLLRGEDHASARLSVMTVLHIPRRIAAALFFGPPLSHWTLFR